MALQILGLINAIPRDPVCLHVLRPMVSLTWDALQTRQLSWWAPSRSPAATPDTEPACSTTLPDAISSPLDSNVASTAGLPPGTDIRELLQSLQNAEPVVGSGPVGLTMQAVDGLHTLVGLPWWATLSLAAVGLRTALIPLTLKQMQASAAVSPLLSQARKEVQNEEFMSQGRWVQVRSIARKYEQLRKLRGAAHPMWIIAAPCIQLPVFVTSMLAIRRMSTVGWEGFGQGGLAWFTNLTLPALDVAHGAMPLGKLGVVLPAAIAVSIFANIQTSFGGSSALLASTKGGGVVRWLASHVKLLLEWLVLPCFLTAMQLPQGTLCYWAASSTFALSQSLVLSRPSVRAALGLPTSLRPPSPAITLPGDTAAAGPAASQPDSSSALGPHHPGLGSALDSAEAASGASSIGDTSGWAAQQRGAQENADAEELARAVDAETEAFAAGTSDVSALFIRAADLRAEGRVASALRCVSAILAAEPENARAWYAAGQLRHALRQWGAAEQAYLRSAELEAAPELAARSWFGAGVVMGMQGEGDAALQAFRRAAECGSPAERASALMAQGSILKRRGELAGAAAAVRAAAELQPELKAKFLDPLEKELAAQRKAGR